MKISISEFLSAFYPDEDEPVWFLGFPAKKLPEGHEDRELKRKKQLTRRTLANNMLLQNNLRSDNKKMGMYFVVNAGGTEKKDINRINAVFCEMDDTPMDEQHLLYNECDLQPSIRTETQKSVHAYWLLKEPMTKDQWETVQCGLIEKFNADAHLKNYNRVMRLPHFNHVSWSDGYQYKTVLIHTFEPERRYTVDELLAAFPHTPPPKPVYAEKGYNDETWEGIKNELRYRISQLPSYRVEHNGTWAIAKGVCHDGKNNSALTVNLRTGAVSCKSGCDYERILNAFNLSKPQKRTGIVRVPARQQSSELYKYLTGQL